MLSAGDLYVTGVLKEFQEYYKITNAQVGLMQTAFIVAYMLFSLAFGYIGDRFNRKIIISIGIFGWSAVMLFSSFVGPNVSLIFYFVLCVCKCSLVTLLCSRLAVVYCAVPPPQSTQLISSC